MWRVLVRQQDAMEELFDGYDADHSGKLNRNGIKGILTKLNDDIPGKSTVQHGSAWISYHI
jgi:Ca2+-binding EF-hand superfamily protein